MANDLGLGKVIHDEQKRDAIHVAVTPVISKEHIYPGQHIGLTGADQEHVTGDTENLIGIADPFLKAPVPPGYRFWMFLYPNTITSLRHDWTHPAFAAVQENNSEQWLRNFASNVVSMSYERLLEVAEEYRADPGAWGHTLSFSTPDECYDESTMSAFWEHYRVVTGKALDKGREKDFFSCSC